MAHAITQERGVAGAVRWTVVRLGLSIFFTMNLMAFTMTMWSLDVYDVQPDPFQQKLYEVFRWLSMLFGLPVLLLLGIPLLQNAVDSWRQRIYSTDLLIATGVAAAYGISVFSVVQGSSAVYFEVGAMVLVAVTLGRWLEATGKQKATEALDQLAALLPVRVLRVAGGVEVELSAEELQEGDELRIRAGERFPTDGVIRTGRTSVDEQVFTGECTPLPRAAGDAVLAGTVNLEGDVVVRATARFRQGSFGRLLQLLKEARTARGHYQRLADRISAWFFPAITVVAVLTLVLHWRSGPGNAIQHCLSVLLIACPCALGLATPLAVWTALSTAIRHQVLFRSGEAIERLAAAQAVCIDKTGTLTTGTPEVTRAVQDESEWSAESLDELATELARASRHPFSKAVETFCSLRNGPGKQTPVLPTGSTATDMFSRAATRVGSLRTVPGAGVEGVLPDGRRARLGSLAFVCDTSPDADTGDGPVGSSRSIAMMPPWAEHLVRAADRDGHSLVALGISGRLSSIFLLRESPRPLAGVMLNELREMRLPVTILTGDRRGRADHLRRELQCPGAFGVSEAAAVRCGSDSGVRESVLSDYELQICSELKPEDKVSMVQQVRGRHGRTIMVGDGINDAPALAVSDVGVAMGCGADVSRDSAQICLLSNDLTRIPWAIGLARRTRAIIRQNLFWAFGYNAAGVCLAAAGWLNPAVAAGLMIVSSLLVISNSLRLMAYADAVRNPPAPRPPLNTAWQPLAPVDVPREQNSKGMLSLRRSPEATAPETVLQPQVNALRGVSP